MSVEDRIFGAAHALAAMIVMVEGAERSNMTITSGNLLDYARGSARAAGFGSELDAALAEARAVAVKQ